tara:strand:- start:2736 stop:2942 length:207 start_codon:yes stop_codon:yes gene_type:complete
MVLFDGLIERGHSSEPIHQRPLLMQKFFEMDERVVTDVKWVSCGEGNTSYFIERTQFSFSVSISIHNN